VLHLSRVTAHEQVQVGRPDRLFEGGMAECDWSCRSGWRLGLAGNRSKTPSMTRRSFLKQAVLAAAGTAWLPDQPLVAALNGESPGEAPAALAQDWLARWE
jgi:hypothetical protein